jgi:hypothetical protein
MLQCPTDTAPKPLDSSQKTRSHGFDGRPSAPVTRAVVTVGRFGRVVRPSIDLNAFNHGFDSGDAA